MQPRKRNLRPHQKYGLHRFESVSELLSVPLANGVSSFLVNNRWFDVMYVDRGAKVTLVTFHAALSPSSEEYPIFSGGKMADELDVNFLAFADAACGSAESLLTFWHMSTRRVEAQQFIPRIIKHAGAGELNKELIFFGSSAGGFAALYYGSLFPGSVSCVVNPRTELRGLPHRFDEYSAVAHPGLDTEAVARRLPVSMAKHYSEPRPNTVAYLQNSEDALYFDNHFTPFMDSCPRNGSIFVKVRDWGAGHVIPPKDEYFIPLRRLCEVAPHWHKGLEDGFDAIVAAGTS